MTHLVGRLLNGVVLITLRPTRSIGWPDLPEVAMFGVHIQLFVVVYMVDRRAYSNTDNINFQE